MSKLALPFGAIALIVFTHILWGGNPVGAKIAMQWVPPFWNGFFRFVCGIAAVLIYAAVLKIKFWPERGEWKPLFLLSFFFFVQISVMNIGFDLSSGSVSSVLNSSYPLFAALTAHFYLDDDRLRPLKSLGLAIAFGGVVLILLRETDFSSFSIAGVGPLLVLFSSVLLGTRVIFSAKMVRSMEPVKVVVWQMALSLPLFALAGASMEEIQWQNFGWGPVLGILYQGVVIAGFGFIVTITLPKFYNPSLITSFGFVSPISGVLLSIWLLGDHMTWHLLAGTVSVGAGLYLIARKPG